MALIDLATRLTSGLGVLTGVDGQFIFGFHIEGLGNFLGDSGTITSFIMEESIGGDVPAFSLKFKTADASVVKSINEGAQMYVLFGKSLFAQYKTAEMVIQTFTNQMVDSEYIHIEIKGLLQNGVEWLRENEQKAFPEMSSIEVIKDVASKYFYVYDSMLSTHVADDRMNWIRPNHSPSRFVDDVWKRSYISDDNTLVYGIEMTGTFVITDIVGIMNQPVKWWLEPYDVDDIKPFTASYNPNIQVNSDFGLMNNMTIHRKVTPVHSMTDGAAKAVETPDLKPTLVAGALNVMNDAPVKYEVQTPIDTTNVHDNYSKSRLISVPKNAMINSVELDIEIENKWQDYLLFDLINFTPYSPHADMFSSPMNESLGGVYCITKIARYYANNRAVIKLTISRDGMNGMEGDLGFSVSGLVGGLINSIF